MILAVANTKGGVGKTTLATNIAVIRSNAGRAVLFVDGDEQRTGMIFTEIRAEQLGSPGYAATCLQGTAIRTQVLMQAPRYDDVIIDCGGRETKSLRASLTVADVALIPIQPRSYDIWALDQVQDLIIEAREINPKLVAYVVLNSSDPVGRDNQDALAAARAMSALQVINGLIGRRKIFSNAGAMGRAVTEFVPKDTKAVEELEAVLKQVFGTPPLLVAGGLK
jgi:chromosome partitioning protein